MNKISVFGGTGFIGGTFCELYPDEIVMISREDRVPQSNNILYFISTTTNQNIFKNLHSDIDVNLKLLMDVLLNCKNKDVTFNFISSGFVYGNDVLDARETDCCNPTGFYSITKRCAEQLLISFCKTFEINYRILRIGNVYGFDKTISPGKNVLGYMINLLKSNQDITLYDGGNFLKDYIHVEDVSRAIKFIMDNGKLNEIYNIAQGESRSFRSIIEELKNITNSKSNIIDVPIPKEQNYIQTKNMTLNVDKLKSLGFSSNINLDRGLKKLCNVV
jgi:nucleoside-diphosphate-sugar epimerase